MDKQHRALRQSGIGLALALGVSGLLLTGCNKSDDTASTTTAPVAPTTPAKTPGGGPAIAGQSPAGRPGPGGMPGKPGGPAGMPGAPAKPGPAGTTAKADPFAPATPGAAAPLTLPGKKFDPFYITWQKAPPPPDPLASGDVQPIRVASAGYQPPPEQEVTVREVPDRRVSGIMSGDGVFAIIEQNGESEVVKPGGTTKDGYRVLAINEDSVKLQKKVGNLNYTQTVQLSDVQTGGPTQAYGRPGGVGQAGFGSGIGQPGPGRPGFGGRAGGGGGKAD